MTITINVSKIINNLNSQHILNSLISGLIAGLFSVIYCVSFAALIFSGTLTQYLPTGIGLLLFTAVVVSALVAIFSSFPPTVAAPQKTTAAVLSLLASSIVTTMPASASLEDKFLTIIAAIIFNSFLSGIFFWLLGWFQLGKFIRFIPYPVIGGFMAGSGWLLLEGSVRLMTGVSIHLLNIFNEIPLLFKQNLLIKWIPGIIFGILLMIILPRYRHFLVLPLMLILAFIIYHSILLLTGISIEVAGNNGLFLGPFPQASGFQFFTISALIHANWSIIFSQFGSLAALCLINAIALLLNASGVELIAERDIDLNQELKVAGIATIFSGFAGGIGGFHSLSQSSLAYRLGGRSRLVGGVVAAVCLVMLLAGVSTLSLVPKALVGGMLFYLGLEFLVEWIYKAWFKLSRADYSIVILILLVVAAVGYLEGVGIGTLAATILFAITCGQMEIIKRTLSGSSYHSNVLRTPEQEQQLREQGDQIYILELQGFLFFGTANKLLNNIRERLEAPDCEPIQFLLIDFRLCTGLDTSAVISFVKLKQITHRKHINLIFVNLNPEYQKQLEQSGGLDIDDPLFHIFADLDRGMEWCEQQIITVDEGEQKPVLSLAEQLKSRFPNPQHIPQLMQYLQPLELQENDYLFRQDDPFNGLYFVESGRVSVVLELSNNQTKRVRSYTGGNTIGEMGLYRQSPRMASVIADQDSSLYFLSNDDFETMESNEPLVAASFHRFIVNLLAERLNHREQELKNLLQ
jgi:sulfate permease, SulP family